MADSIDTVELDWSSLAVTVTDQCPECGGSGIEPGVAPDQLPLSCSGCVGGRRQFAVKLRDLRALLARSKAVDGGAGG